MYFYITNSLGAYSFNTTSQQIFFDKEKPYLAKKKYETWVKVGIAKNISERFENYKTINPKIACVHQIKCTKIIALNLEDAFKRYLNEKRVYGSECYHLTPKEALYFATRCLTHIGMANVHHVWASGNKKYESVLYYLDSIYFGGRIPLFELVSKSYASNLKYNKIKYWNRELAMKYYRATDYHAYNSELEIDFKYNKKNIFFDLMDDFDKEIVEIIDNDARSSLYIPHNPWKSYVYKDRIHSIVSRSINNLIFKFYEKNKNKNIKRYFYKDMKFLNDMVSKTKDADRYECLDHLNNRKIIAFDYLYSKNGPPGKKLKNDPYQLMQERYFYKRHRTVLFSKANYRKLIRPE
jgi:hypothetical protein